MYKTIKGIVLKRNKFAENSAYITVLSEQGLVKFSAKGISSQKNKNSPACVLYALSEFVLSYHQDSATLSSASLIKPLIRQGVDFGELAVANYITCLAHDVAFTEEDAPSIFSLLGIALSIINKKVTSPEIIKAVFELRLMSALGFEPDIECCQRCGKPFIEGQFLTLDGGVLCNDCEVFCESTSKIPLSANLHDALKTLLSLPPHKAFGIKFKDSIQEKNFVRLAEEFSINHLDSAIGALTFYKNNIKNITESI